jgi:hypothetical protein
MLFSYRTTYKVTTRYTPYQIVYRLHPLMPTKYIVLVTNGNQKDNISMKVLTSRVLELEKLQEVRMEVGETIGSQQWNRTLWSQQKNL